jgi:hypothetical protein
MRRPFARSTRVGALIAAAVSGCVGAAGCDTILVGDLHIEPGCEPGARRCGDSAPQRCNPSGLWEDEAPCAKGKSCFDGACVDSCMAGDLRCLDDKTPQVCDAKVGWSNNGVPCDSCSACDPVTSGCAASPLEDGKPCTDPPGECFLPSTCQVGVCTCGQ